MIINALWRAVRHPSKIIFYLTLLSLFDAVVDGGIVAIMQNEAWNQKINDMYQFGFGLISLSLVVSLSFESTQNGFVFLILLIGYVEDILFYLLIPVVNPLILLLTGYAYSIDGIFPKTFSGWIGWVGRRIGLNINLPVEFVLIVSLSAILFVLILKRRAMD